MMGTAPCRRRTLAEGDCCRVDQCDCGHVHLSIGGVTLRLMPEALRDIATTLRVAVATSGLPLAAPRPAWSGSKGPRGN